VVQIIAGILAGFAYSLILNCSINLHPTPGHDCYQAFIAELLPAHCIIITYASVLVLKEKQIMQKQGR